MGKVKVGIVGTGNLMSIATAHLNAYRDNDNVEIVALYDVDFEQSVKWAQKHGVSCSLLCHSYQELLSKVDAVSICTPNSTHSELVTDAMKAGVHVLCEKPISATLEEGRKVAEMAKHSGLVNMIGFCYRNVPAIRYMKQLVDSGKLGQIYLYRATMGGSRLANPKVPLEWRMVRQFSGAGALADFGSHLLDTAEYITANIAGNISGVCGYLNTFIQDRPDHEGISKVENDDCAVFSAVTKNGTLMNFTGSRLGSLGHKIEVAGSGGIIMFDGGQQNKLTVNFKDVNGAYEGDAEVVDVPAEFNCKTSIHNEIDRFVSAILSGDTVCPDLSQGVHIQHLIDCLEQSAVNENYVNVIECQHKK